MVCPIACLLGRIATLAMRPIAIDGVAWSVGLSVTSVLFNKSSAVAEMVDRLATIDMGRKVGVLCPFTWGSWVPI